MIVGKLNPKYNRKIKNNSKTVLETPINAKKEKMTKVAKQAIRAIIEMEIMCNMNTPKTPNCFRQLGVLLGVRENVVYLILIVPLL